MNTKTKLFFPILIIATVFMFGPVADNATAMDWNISTPPRIFAQYTDDHIRFEYTDPGAEVTFSIYGSQGGDLLWEDNRTADENGFAMVSIWDHKLDLQPYMFIVVSDGVTTKELLLEPLSLDTFDSGENIMAGTADPGREVWVVPNNDPDACGVVVTADVNGAWSHAFDPQVCPLYDASGSYAQVMDEDDDTTEVFVAFIDGTHDYDQSDVPHWACNAGGWAVDTDDRDRDLDIHVLADGEIVTSIIAGNPTDLTGICGEDGTCGYEVSLWGLITPYEEHQITVQAYDQETEQWLDLNGTPRQLTCRTYDIYIYDTLTGDTRQLTNLRDSWEFNPRWSPDGRRIVHDRWSLDLENNLGVYISQVDTGESTPLAGAENGNYPAWSPNGQWIAFNQGEDLYLLSPSGGEPRLVRENAYMASWAPSSQRLVFNQPSDGSILTTDLSGRNEIVVAEHGNGPAWSPNGLWIAYELDGDLWKVRVDWRGMPLGNPIQMTNQPAWEGRPSWSVDSRTIVFHKGFDRDTDLWTIPTAGGQAIWLTGAPNFADYDPNYSNNGRYVAYSSFSPAGQAPRNWGGIYTRDLPAGFWSEGKHTYFYRYDFEPGISEELTFNVSEQAQLYDGLVLLRPRFQWARVDEGCDMVEMIHPNQQTQFHFGWVTDDVMIYQEALAFFENLRPVAAWDEGLSMALERKTVLPFYASEDWSQYVCWYTFPK